MTESSDSDSDSDSDSSSDLVTLYSVVKASSDDCSDSLYSVVVRGLCVLKARVLDGALV